MWQNIKSLFQKRGLEISIYAMLLVLILNSVFILRYRIIIAENVELQGDLLEITGRRQRLEGNINRADMAFRGYLLHTEESMILPFKYSEEEYPDNIRVIQSLLIKHGYDGAKLEAGNKAIKDYLEEIRRLVNMARNGNVEQAVAVLKTDPGYKAWEIYYPMMIDVENFVNELEAKTQKEYNSIIAYTKYSQIVVLILAIPFLFAIVRRLRSSRARRRQLFEKIDESKRQYLFDEKRDDDTDLEESEIINDLVKNLKKASDFINNITEGNYNIAWEGLDKDNWKFNENNLSGELTKMRDQMIKVKKEDEKRLWTTEGLSKFGEIIRNYQNNINTLSDEIISNLVKYLGAKQGGIFVLNDEKEHNQYLELTGCYAYERKKFLDRKIEIGDGLVGQCFLEKEHIYIKNVPQDYVKITSGLGETNPSSLLLVPLKNESVVTGVIEIASLNEFEPHQIEFVIQLAETIASAIQNVKTNQSTHELLEKTQQQAEEMRAQEEEMRQNMEELQATQEAAARREKEMTAIVEALEVSFLVAEYNAVGQVTKMNDSFVDFLHIDKSKAESYTVSDILASSDKTKEQIDSLWNDLKRGKTLREDTQYTLKGKEYWLSETFTPIVDYNGEIIKILNIAINITENKEQQKQVKKLLDDFAKEKYLLDAMLDNMPDSIYFKDQKSRFIRVSKFMATTFGFESPTEVVGMTDFDFQDKEHAQQAFDDEMKIIKTETPMIDMVEKETFEDGTVRWISTTKLPLKDLNDKVVGTFGISRDISKIKNLETEYQEKLAKLEEELKKYRAGK